LASFVFALPLSAVNAVVQQTNPPHLSQFPAVEKVMNTMKTADPRETALRQIGAFYQLTEIIKTLSGPREFRGLTPDEQRVMGVYQTASFKVAEAASKVFPGAPKPGEATDFHFGRWDPRFGIEGIQTFQLLLPPTIKAEFDRIVKADLDRRKAREQANQNTIQPVQPASSSGTGPGSSAELRRCIESGRSRRNCFSESMTSGFDKLTGLASLKEPPKPGFRMSGDYSTNAGFRLIFQPEQVTMICHAVPAKRQYTVEITETQTLIKIQNESKTVVLSLLPNGKLSGSGPIHVVGQVPAGQHTEQTYGQTTQNTTRTRQLSPGEERYYQNATKNGQVWTVQEDTTELVYGSTGSRTVTDFVTKSADCNLGLMKVDGPTPLPPDLENPMGLITAIFSGAGTLMKGGSQKDALKEMLNLNNPIAPGLRMGGTYAGTNGLSLTFHPESVTLSCGEAHRALEYSIQRTGTQTSLQLNDKTNPVSFQVRPDGSLFGQGSVQVNGRVIVGTNESQDPDNMFVYEPRVARCEVGRLVGGATVSGGPLSSPSGGASTGAATSSGVTVIPGSGPPTLVIKSGFPNQPPDPNPLAGVTLLILKESLDTILARGGFGQTSSPGSGLAGYARACQSRTPQCQQAGPLIGPHMVANARLDTDGGTTFNGAQLGTYYIVLEARLKAQHFLWNVRVDMKQGTNVVTVGPANASPLTR
jgi:hypothetical protein